MLLVFLGPNYLEPELIRAYLTVECGIQRVIILGIKMELVAILKEQTSSNRPFREIECSAVRRTDSHPFVLLLQFPGVPTPSSGLLGHFMYVVHRHACRKIPGDV